MQNRTIRFPSQVSAANAGELTQRVKEAVAFDPCILVLDLADVTYMTTAGLGVMVYAFKLTHEHGGALRVSHARKAVRGLIRHSRFDLIFEMFDPIQDEVVSARSSSH